MPRRTRTAASTPRPSARVVAATLAAASAALLAAPAGAGAAELFYGVTGADQLVSFTSQAPLTLRTSATITGVQSGETIVGLDTRPATGQLYALGTQSRIYVINPFNAVAREVGSAPFAPLLVGGTFGFDVDPVTDRIRVVGDGDQNLRINPDTGNVTNKDGRLAFAAGDPNAGANPVVGSAAYTNPVPGAKTTELYVLDTGRDVLAKQVPDSGSLATRGKLGLDAGEPASFDVTTTGAAFATFTVAGQSGARLWAINLATGAATPAARDPRIGGRPPIALAAVGQVADDRTPPSQLLQVTAPSKASLRSIGLRMRFTCNEGCTTTATLLVGRRAIGRASAVLSGPGVGALRVRLTSAGKRLVGTTGTTVVTLRVAAVDGAGNTRPTTQRMTIR